MLKLKRVKKSRTQKRTVEIYFVLYLAALMLLLPDSKTKQSTQYSELLQSLIAKSFILRAEKPSLNVQYFISGDSMSVVSIDTANTLYALGAVENVHFEYSIEDKTTSQQISFSGSAPLETDVFQVEPSHIANAMKFIWSPSVEKHQRLQSKTYLVRVHAFAKPKLDENLGTEHRVLLRDLGVELQAETEFTLNILASSEQVAQFPPSSTTGVNPSQFSFPFPPSMSSSASTSLPHISLSAQYETIKTIAYQEWSNVVRVYGMDLLNQSAIAPIIAVRRSSADVGGNAIIANVRPNEIVIQGISPSSGSLTVTLRVRRAGDNEESSLDFVVAPSALATPDFPSDMMPGVTYVFKPNLPFVVGQETKANLMEGKTMRVSSQQGGDFNFTPLLSDTGKTFTIERYVNGKSVGQSFTSRVGNFPSPEILEVLRRGDFLFVRTRSYGKLAGKDNRGRIEFESNSTKVTEMYGDYRFESAYHAHIQLFKLSIDGYDLSRLKLRVRDVRGAASPWRTLQ